MKLIKLTATDGNSVYISTDQIVGLVRDASYTGSPMVRTEETMVYTSRRGLYYRVKETPEEIERLANS